MALSDFQQALYDYSGTIGSPNSIGGLLKQIVDNTSGGGTGGGGGGRRTTPTGGRRTAPTGGRGGGESGLGEGLPMDFIEGLADFRDDIASTLTKYGEQYEAELQKRLDSELGFFDKVNIQIKLKYDKQIAAQKEVLAEEMKYLALLEMQNASTDDINAQLAKIAGLHHEINNLLDERNDKMAKQKSASEEIARNLSQAANAWTRGFQLGLGDLNDALAQTFRLRLGWDEILSNMLDINRELLKMSISIGFGENQLQQMTNVLVRGSSQFREIGLLSDEATKIMGDFMKHMGGSVMLTEQEVMLMGEVVKGMGMSADQAGKFFAESEKFGVSIEQSHELMQGLSDESREMGVNLEEVVAQLDSALPMLKRFTFKGGLDDLTEMAVKAEVFRLSLSEVEKVASKFRFDIEGSVKATAQLQALGGKFASTFSNPFELMYKARANPKGLMDDIISASDGFAIWNKEIGKFEIPPLQQHRIEQIAEATGLAADSIRDVALQSAKIGKVADALSFKADDKTSEFLANIARADGKGGFKVLLGDEWKEISELTPSMIKQLEREQKTLKENAETALQFDERLAALINSFKAKFLPLLPMIERFFNGVISFLSFFDNLGGQLLLIIPLLWGSTKLLFAAFGGGIKLMFSSLMGGLSGMLGKIVTASGALTGAGTAGGAAGGGAAAAAGSAVGPMLALGAAAVMVGYGISLVVDSVAGLAEAIKPLTEGQLEQLNDMLVTLGLTFGLTMAAIVAGITVLGLFATSPLSWAAIGILLSIGAAAVMVGAGMGLAALAVGKYVEAQAKLAEASKVDYEGMSESVKTINDLDEDKVKLLKELAEASANAKPIEINVRFPDEIQFDDIDINVAGKMAATLTRDSAFVQGVAMSVKSYMDNAPMGIAGYDYGLPKAKSLV